MVILIIYQREKRGGGEGGSPLLEIMKILSWNCQGLRNPWMVCSLHKVVREQALQICFLMETRLDLDGLNQWCDDLPFKNRFVVKKPGLGGRLALMWKEDVNLGVFKFSEHQISTKVTKGDGFQWILIGFMADQRLRNDTNFEPFYLMFVPLLMALGCASKTSMRS